MSAMAAAECCCGVKYVASSFASAAGRPKSVGSRASHSLISIPARNFSEALLSSTAALSLGSSALATLPSREKRYVGNGVHRRGLRIAGALSPPKEAAKVQPRQWTWTHNGSPIKINAVDFVTPGSSTPTQTILMLPTISDVSTTEEWHAVAEGLLSKSGTAYKIVCVDWPGLGLSDRPAIDYTADLYEKFLVDFVSAKDGPLGSLTGPLVIIGGGHSATIAARAVSKGLLDAAALALVAPTWAGPLPIVFGRDETMENRYGLLRSTLNSPGVGWAMYKYVVSSPKNIRLQYLTHVYADADNVTPSVVEKRTALTQREGARYAPSAFLTGLLDPTRSRQEFVDLFANLEGKVPTLVMLSLKSPKRSKAEMEALEGAKGVTKFVRVPGALLPQEEYPDAVTDELVSFLESLR